MMKVAREWNFRTDDVVGMAQRFLPKPEGDTLGCYDYSSWDIYPCPDCERSGWEYPSLLVVNLDGWPGFGLAGYEPKSDEQLEQETREERAEIERNTPANVRDAIAAQERRFQNEMRRVR